MNFNLIIFIHFLLVFISIIYAFEVTGKNNFDIKWNGLPQMATFNNYEDMDKYIESSRKMDTIENPTMDSYLTAYNLHHLESNNNNNNNNKHNINKRSANPYDYIKFELSDAKIPDEHTKELLKVNHEREQKKLKDEDVNGPPIILGNHKKTNTSSKLIKIIKRSDDQINIDDSNVNAAENIYSNNNEDQEISESRRTLNFYQPRLNSGMKTKKSIKSFPHEVQKAINLILNDKKLNNNLIGGGVGSSSIGLRYAPTHKQFYGDKIITNNNNYNDGNFHHKLQQLNNKYKYIYTPSQILYNNNNNNYNSDGISHYGGGTPSYINVQTEIDDNEKQIISKTPSVIIGNGIAPAPSSSLDSHLSEISDVHTLIQPQTLVKIEPEINYVIQEVQPPPPSSPPQSPQQLSDQLAAKPSISYKHYLSAPNILQNHNLLTKSIFIPSEFQFNDVKNKEYLVEHIYNNNNNNDASSGYGGVKGNFNDAEQQQHQFEQISYESLGDYEKQIIKEHNLFNGVNEQHQLTGKENNNNENGDDSYNQGSGEKFNILSSLIGKSPSEQLNGLSYLLENELINNNNKNEQQQHQEQQQEVEIIPKRPQDNRSPILFHPDNKNGAGVVGQGKNIIINKYGFKELTSSDNNQHKDYKPITEAPEEIHSHRIVHITPSPLPPPVSTSYKHVHSNGLSPNYKDIDFQPKEFGMKLDDKGLQYASNYAFGYRVRDFHTGNDFGHKQNRDLDGVTRGEYHILLPDGRVQNVRYHADDSGFHADVSFESGH